MITDCSNSRLPASTGVGYFLVELLCMNSWLKLVLSFKKVIKRGVEKRASNVKWDDEFILLTK